MKKIGRPKKTTNEVPDSLVISKKKRVDINRNVETLFQMDRRRKILLATRDRNGLLVLAAEYRALGANSIANELHDLALSI